MDRFTLTILLAATQLASAQTLVDLKTQSTNADLTQFPFTRTVRLGSPLPSTCTVGDLFLLSTATPGRSLHGCLAVNTWSVVGGDIATQAEAENGTLDTKLMTPLKTAQAIAAQCALPNPIGSLGSILSTDGSSSSWSRTLAIPADPPVALSVTTQTISTSRLYAQVQPNAVLTLSSAPTIADGANGQILVITNVSTANTVTLQDEAVLTGSNLRLGGANVTLAPRESLQLIFNDALRDWVRVGGGAGASSSAPSVQMVRYQGAKCQNTVAGTAFSLPSSNAPTPLCDSGANALFGVLRYTANGQIAQDSFVLPPTFSSVSAVITSRTASTSGSTVWTIESACVGQGEGMGAGAAGGPTFSNSNSITLAAVAANGNTISGETSLTTTGCAANELFMFRLSRNASTTVANPELVALGFKIQ